MVCTKVIYTVVTDALQLVEVTYYMDVNEWQVEFLPPVQVDKIAFPGKPNKVCHYIDAVEHAARHLGINILHQKKEPHEPTP